MAGRWWTGPGLAVLGGATWATHAVVLGSRPEGCVAEGCWAPGASNRPSEDLAWLLLSAVVVLTVAVGRLVEEVPRRGRRLITAGKVLMLIGASLLAGGVVANAVLAGNSPLWWLHDTDSLGRLVPVAGAFVAGLGVLRSRQPARWVGAVLVVGSVVALPVNAQDDRVLLSIPLGLAWVVTGGWWAVRRTLRREAPVG